MKRSSLRTISFAFAIFASASLFHSARVRAAENAIHPEERAFRLFGGAAIGYGNASGSPYTKAADGPQYLLNADLSYQNTHLVADLGAGWLYSKLQGQVAAGLPADVRTRMGFADASLRYRLSDNWQLGPAYNLGFGTDTTFKPALGSDSTVSLVGLRAVYECELGGFPFRVIAQGLTKVDRGGPNYTLASLGFQIGLPLFGSTNQTDTVRTSNAAGIRGVIAEDNLAIQLDPERVFFDTNSSRIKPKVKRVLQDIGAYLAKNRESWKALKLSGHADQRGRAEYNLKLSKKRTRSVLEALASAGVDVSRVSQESFGFSRPVDPSSNRIAWAKNRRVELVLADVKDVKKLKQKLEQLTQFKFDPNH